MDNQTNDLIKIAKIWQLQLNIEYSSSTNVRLSFKDVGAICEHWATYFLPGYIGGGSGASGFDLINKQDKKAIEVKSCCTIQNSSCKNLDCKNKFNSLFYKQCPYCQGNIYTEPHDSRFGIDASETLRQINEGFFGGIIFCHISKIDESFNDKTLTILAEWYKLDFSDCDIQAEQLKYFTTQQNNGSKSHCNLIPNKFDFFKLCPLKINETKFTINYADISVEPSVCQENFNEYPKVPKHILYKSEKKKFESLQTYDPATQTADCKDFTLNLPYRHKTLGKIRGDTRKNLYDKLK